MNKTKLTTNQSLIVNDKLVKFLNSWKKKNYKEMYSYTQKTWRSSHDSSSLKYMCEKRNLISYKIKKITLKEVTSDIIVKLVIKYEVNNNTKNYDCIFRLIKETRPYEPSKNGTWGVNPVSGLHYIK